MKCRNCGYENNGEAKYCSKCGKILPTPLPVDAQARIEQSRQKKAEPFPWWGKTIITIGAVLYVLSVLGSNANQSDSVNASGEPKATTAAVDVVQRNNEPLYEVAYSKTWSAVNSLGQTVAYSIFEIENKTDYSIYLGGAAVDYEDSTGHFVGKDSMPHTEPNIVAPGEKGYVYSQETLEGDAPNGELHGVMKISPKKARVENLCYDIEDLSFTKNEKWDSYKFLGRIVNNTGDDRKWAIISAVMFDADGRPITVHITNVFEEIKDGESCTFELSGSVPRGYKLSDIASYKLYAYPEQFQW